MHIDNVKIGRLIYKLRKEKNYTQLQLAELMGISDKTISKWERGLGCPEISLISDLAQIFDVDLKEFLSGELSERKFPADNLGKINFHICPNCNNLVTSMAETDIYCCGKKLNPMKLKNPYGNEMLIAEKNKNELYITTKHSMDKTHYITFVALLTNDTLILKKLYPEWEMQAYFPFLGKGKILWHCSKHGLFVQEIK